MRSRRPRVLRIGAHTWRVRWSAADVARLLDDPQDQAQGAMNSDSLEIAVEPTKSREKERAVLLHEVLHACVESSDPGLSYEDEERAVAAITAPLLHALRTNPTLARYLLEDDRG